MPIIYIRHHLAMYIANGETSISLNIQIFVKQPNA